jgi:predicted nucleic acid-binding protein
MLDLIPVTLPISPRDMQTAVQLFAQYGPSGVKARDVTHAAVMENNGITKIISTDRHFDQFPNIVRLDPPDLYAGAKAAGWQD